MQQIISLVPDTDISPPGFVDKLVMDDAETLSAGNDKKLSAQEGQRLTSRESNVLAKRAT